MFPALFLSLLLAVFCKTLAVEEEALPNVGDKGDWADVSEVSALYDHESNVALFKDPSIPACFIQNLLENFQEPGKDHPEVILAGKPWNASLGLVVSRFQKEFCSNLPLFEMEPNEAAIEGKHRVHRTRRNAAGYGRQYSEEPSRDSKMGQYPFPGSQTQVEGNVAGNGHFSGQAQSTYGGLSQSQIQLGGVGLTGRISSIAGGTQSALRLGTRSGSGQIASSGNGPSASELQLNLGEQGQESRAHAIVMQHHQPGSGQPLLSTQDFGSQQHQSSQIASGMDSYRQQSYADTGNRFPYSGFNQISHRGSGSYGSSSNMGTQHAGNQFQSQYASQDSQGSRAHDGHGARTQFNGFATVSNGHQTLPRTDTTSSNRHDTSASATGRSRQSRIYQYATGSNGEAKFRTDSVSIKDSPNMASGAGISRNGHGSDQVFNQGRTFQRINQEQSVNGFRVSSRPNIGRSQPNLDTETQIDDSQRYPAEQPNGHRVESTRDEIMTNQRFPVQQTNGQRTESTRDESTTNQRFPAASEQNGIPASTYPQRGPEVHSSQTETSAAFQTSQRNGIPVLTYPQRGPEVHSSQTETSAAFQTSQRNVIPASTYPQRGPEVHSSQTETSAAFQTSQRNGHAQRVDTETQAQRSRRPKVHDKTDLSAVFQSPQQNGHHPRTDTVQMQYDNNQRMGGRGQRVHESETDLSAVFQAPQPSGRVHETQTDLSAVFQAPQPNGRAHETQTDMSAVFQTPPQNGHVQRTETIQSQYGGSSHTRPSTAYPGHATEDSLVQRAYSQMTNLGGEMPMMTSYPITNGRRVYQRRIVTYYPGQMTPVTQHYVQQTMTGRQPQLYPDQNGHSMTPSQGDMGDKATGNCHTVTLQCTVIFDSNGKSKLCQPKPVNTGAQSNICCC